MQRGSACLSIEKSLCDALMIVEVKQDAAAPWVALKAVQLPIAVVPHEIKAQLPCRSGLLAEALHPVPDLHTHAPRR